MGLRQCGTAGLALLLVVGLAGCGPYWQDRGNDAKDMFEAGLTVSAKPGFAIYQDYFNYIPHGFSSVDGCFIGNANRKLGISKLKDHSWGYLTRGRHHLRVGELDPADHHQISPAYVEKLKAEGKPMPTENPGWDNGVWGVKPDGPAPWPSFISCRRNVHLGFIGVHLSMHPGDILDFLLGWTTVDIMKDDYHTQAARNAVEPEAAAAPAK